MVGFWSKHLRLNRCIGVLPGISDKQKEMLTPVFGRKPQWNLKWVILIAVCFLLSLSVLVVSEELDLKTDAKEVEMDAALKIPNLSSIIDGFNYQPIWPNLKFGWRIMVGSIAGFFGAAFGSVGGVGGGGIFVPVLMLIVGFDVKSSIAISQCMMTGTAVSSLYYKLQMRRQTLDSPIIDYNLALLLQPMLLLGVSIGVVLNVIFPDCLVIVLLIILFLGIAMKALLRGVETWRKEYIIRRVAAHSTSSPGDDTEIEHRLLPSVTRGDTRADDEAENKDTYWKEFSLVLLVWLLFFVLQIARYYTTTCSTWYWVFNLLQIPVSICVTLYEAVSLYMGKRVITSNRGQEINWKLYQLLLSCFCGILSGTVAGLLGVGGGFIFAPLLLKLGVPPEVSSATATFAMSFSSSMSVVEYYLLKRFPLPYTMYFVVITIIASLLGPHIVRRLIVVLGRASFIIFILALTILASAISLGVVYMPDIIKELQHYNHMGFDNICKYMI